VLLVLNFLLPTLQSSSRNITYTPPTITFLPVQSHPIQKHSSRNSICKSQILFQNFLRCSVHIFRKISHMQLSPNNLLEDYLGLILNIFFIFLFFYSFTTSSSLHASWQPPSPQQLAPARFQEQQLPQLAPAPLQQAQQQPSSLHPS